MSTYTSDDLLQKEQKRKEDRKKITAAYRNRLKRDPERAAQVRKQQTEYQRDRRLALRTGTDLADIRLWRAARAELPSAEVWLEEPGIRASERLMAPLVPAFGPN